MTSRQQCRMPGIIGMVDIYFNDAIDYEFGRINFVFFQNRFSHKNSLIVHKFVVVFALIVDAVGADSYIKKNVFFNLLQTKTKQNEELRIDE